MQHRQEGADNLPGLKTWTKLVHWTLTSQSTEQVTCFELVMKRDHFNWSSSAKGTIAPAVLLMRENTHCQIYWQILHPEKNVVRSTVLQVRGRKSPLLLGGETLGLRCSVDADRVMYNQCGCGADSGQKLLMRCGQRAQIFCPRHLDYRLDSGNPFLVFLATELFMSYQMQVQHSQLLYRRCWLI